VLDTVHVHVHGRDAVKERFVRIRVTAASATALPQLDELTATG